MPHGGHRPGAGAPKGNLNALKAGRYSKRLEAFRSALDAMPVTADMLVRLTARDRRRMELLAYGLQYYADMLLMIAKGGSIKKRVRTPRPDIESAGAPGPRPMRPDLQDLGLGTGRVLPNAIIQSTITQELP